MWSVVEQSQYVQTLNHNVFGHFDNRWWFLNSFAQVNLGYFFKALPNGAAYWDCPLRMILSRNHFLDKSTMVRFDLMVRITFYWLGHEFQIPKWWMVIELYYTEKKNKAVFPPTSYMLVDSQKSDWGTFVTYSSVFVLKNCWSTRTRFSGQ